MKVGNPDCDHCSAIETTIHVLRDCNLAMVIWMHIVRLDCRDDFFNSSLEDWIAMNMSQHLGVHEHLNWQAMWANACHLIWTWRNKENHDTDFLRPWRPWDAVVTETADYYNRKKTQVMSNDY